MSEESPRDIVAATVADLRLIAGRSGTEEFLERLLQLNPYNLQGAKDAGGLNPEEPLPMFFDNGWQEVLNLLLAEARKA